MSFWETDLFFFSLYLAIPTCIDSPPRRTVSGPENGEEMNTIFELYFLEIKFPHTATVTIANAPVLSSSHANVICASKANSRDSALVHCQNIVVNISQHIGYYRIILRKNSPTGCDSIFAGKIVVHIGGSWQNSCTNNRWNCRYDSW